MTFLIGHPQSAPHPVREREIERDKGGDVIADCSTYAGIQGRVCQLHCPLRIGATPQVEELEAASAHLAQEKEEG
jgi:hypothetical protein